MMSTTSQQIAPIRLPAVEWLPHLTLLYRIQESFSHHYDEVCGPRAMVGKSLKLKGISFPHELMEEDYCRLEQHSLPLLKPGMSCKEWQGYLRAYRKIEPAPLREFSPMRPTKSAAYARWIDAGSIAQVHHSRLNAKVQAEEIPAWNSLSRPVGELSLDARLRKEDVEGYLIQSGLRYEFETSPSKHADAVIGECPECSNLTQGLPAGGPALRRPKGCTHEWTNEELRLLEKDVANETWAWEDIQKAWGGRSRKALQEKLRQKGLTHTRPS